MRKIKLAGMSLIFAIVLIPNWLNAQCTPNTALTWTQNSPDTLVPGCVGEPYSEVIYFSFPRDTVQVFPVTMDSYLVLSAVLPAGLSYACNTANCHWTLANTPTDADHFFGCITISGTPTASFTGVAEITIEGWTNVFGPVSGNSTEDFAIVIGDTTVADFTSSAAGLDVTFTDASTSPSSWLWDFGDGGSSILQSPMHSYASSGTYTVCLTTTNGTCTDSTCSTVNAVFVADNQLISPASVSVYPNPAGNHIFIETTGMNSGKFNVRMMNLQGQIFHSANFTASASEKKFMVDLTEIPNGFYLIEIDNGQEKSIRKIVVN